MESSSLATTTTTNSSTSSELFICFTSRLSSSSSMKISSKSILSPGRARDSSQISLTSSLSRRLKSSGSLKGGQASPMFPTAGKKRSGCAFENPEPSSPKVTCIGQVRVKTKKQGKKMRSRSLKRRSNSGGGGGEASFRRADREKKKTPLHCEGGGGETKQKLEEAINYHSNSGISSSNNNNNNQKSVTICEALRTFGAEFNCFLPCRSSCMTTAASEKENSKADKRTSSSTSSNGRSCGAVFARWLVSLQDGEGKGREIELVVGEEREEEEEEREREEMERSLRRRVFEGIEFKEEEIRSGYEEGGEEKGRVSICIPPKNALLLMRCRSDPVKMAALANRFWDPPQKDEEEEDKEVNEEEEKCEDGELEVGVHYHHQQSEMCGGEVKSASSSSCNELAEREEVPEAEQLKLQGTEEEKEEEVEEEEEEYGNEENPKRISTEVVVVVGGLKDETQGGEPEGGGECQVVVVEQEQEEGNGNVEGEEEMDVIKLAQELEEENTDLNGSIPEALAGPEETEKVEDEEQEESEPHCEEEQKFEEKEEENQKPISENQKQEDEGEENQKPISENQKQEDEGEENQKPISENRKQEEKVAEGSTEEEEEEVEQEIRDQKTGRGDPNAEREMGSPGLPDCLLLMMCEPKLSMEVSKETWVCSTDFIRWLPDRRRVNPKKGPEEPKKRPNAAAAADGPQLMQPPRSSVSFPLVAAAPPQPQSMASVIEQKLAGAKAPYEPFVLKRCKSEPMRSATKLAADACFWKNRKLEPHRPATLGVGAAGVGF